MWKLYLPALIFIVSIANAIAPIVPPRVAPSSQAENLPVEGPEVLSPVVTLQAASGKTIFFKTGNGVPREGRPSQEREIPHLVLKRNGVLTSPEERLSLIHI